MTKTKGRLGDLCDLVGLQVDPASYSDDAYLGLEHLAAGRFKRIGVGKASDVFSGKYLFQSGDILYSKLRPYLDKAVLVDESGICTTELLVLRAKEGVDARFIVSVIHTPSFIEHAVAGTTGVQHPRTSWNHISAFKLLAFKPSERVKIANLVWEVHDAITTNESIIDVGKELKSVAMQTLFTRGLRSEAQKETEIGLVPQSWDVKPLIQAASIERGRFLHRPRNEPRFYGGSTPFVQTGDVVRAHGRIREFSQTLNADGVAISRVFPAGTILITIAANIGYTGVLQFDSACPDSLVAISPRACVNTLFLEYFLQTQRPEMDRRAPKGTQKNINIQFLNPWPIPIPQLVEQHEIAAILETIDCKIDLHRRKLAVLDSLFKSILQQLMNGEICIGQLDHSAKSLSLLAGAAA